MTKEYFREIVDELEITDAKLKKEKEKTRKTALICLIIFIVSVTTFCLYEFLVNIYYQTSISEYENVDYEWDDDKDRYDIFIQDIGHLYIETKNAKLIFLPSETTFSLARIKYGENAIKTRSKYFLTDFYINVGWKGEER